MSIKIEWDFSNIESELIKIGEDVQKLESIITLKQAQAAVEKMKPKIPYSDIRRPEYKHIKDSIKIGPLKDDKMGTRHREIYGVGETGFKWRYLEFGTTKMNAIPFMQPSLDETEQERLSIANEELEKVLGK